MLAAEVIAGELAGHATIVREVRLGSIYELMAVAMVQHISVDVCVIMAQIYRSGMAVVVREVIPVPG